MYKLRQYNNLSIEQLHRRSNSHVFVIKRMVGNDNLVNGIAVGKNVSNERSQRKLSTGKQ